MIVLLWIILWYILPYSSSCDYISILVLVFVGVGLFVCVRVVLVCVCVCVCVCFFLENVSVENIIDYALNKDLYVLSFFIVLMLNRK